MDYAPRVEFVEVYLDHEYQGVYMLSETIKVGKNRVDIPKAENSYLIEVDEKYREDETVFFSNEETAKTFHGEFHKPFRVHRPKKISDASLNKIENYVNDFEEFLKVSVEQASLEEIEKWIDIESFAKHFWVQEFSKNPDANYTTSYFFTWTEGENIKMGPVWDFDLAYGDYPLNANVAFYEGWRIKDAFWNAYLFKNEEFEKKVNEYWSEYHGVFESVVNTIDSLGRVLEPAAKNNFKRWDILQSDVGWVSAPVSNYGEAVDKLKKWINQRMSWIDANARIY